MRPLVIALVALAVCLGRPTTATAHRLDEWLQATRVSLAVDRIDLEIDLTPGAALAAAAFSSIDTDRNGTISSSEGQAYAHQVLNVVTLSVDGQGATVTLVDGRFPDLAAMTAGVGTIRLRAIARLPNAGPGRHSVTYGNAHRPAGSVYLANALVPTDPRITIATQRRDPLQHMLTVDYDVAYGAWWRALGLFGGAALVVVIALVRRGQARRVRSSA